MKCNFIRKMMAIGLALVTVAGCIGSGLTMNAEAAQVQGAGINVDKIDGITDDFIMGMDVSSYVSVTNSGVVFKDFDGNALDAQGFFNLLKSCGINYIRVRVWNDPYDENGNGYGGGNCDIENAAVIGKYATAAGMKLLVDFHYSDFWADPAKQMVPKAWENYTLAEKETAIYEYTKTSLQYLKNQGVNIGMVQVGNETTSAFCGESNWDNMCKLFSAGSKAIREVDSNILIALHFTDPQKNRYNTHATYLKNNGVDYDVFASSFYPEWHGTLSNLSTQLQNIASKYGKKVMIVETSYPYTLDDLDGHDNTINKWTHSNPPVAGYPEASVQGQADYMATIIETTVNMGGIGVCYWEGAWNSVGNPYVGAGGWTESIKTNNKLLWEKYGSGWATSYAASYDPKDVGTWYGGSAVDNQSFFDVNGKALASLNVFNYVKTGATTEGGQTETTTQAKNNTTESQTTTSNSTSTVEPEVTTAETESQIETETKETEAEETTVKDEETEKETESDNDETSSAEKESGDVSYITTYSANTDNNSSEKEGISALAMVFVVLAVAAVIGGAATVIVLKKKGKI